MSNDADLLEAVHALPEEAQQSVLSYALFLRQQEGRLREEDTVWDDSFSDPEKMKRFTEWTQQSLSESAIEPLDLSRACY